MRAFWSGEIAFGLVTIPAKLYTATKDLTPQFHQLHKECGTRITMVRRCPKCNRDLPWDEIGKGYEVSKGEYALFTKEELAELDGEDSAGVVEIVEFVDPLEVDLAYIEKSYWVGPGSKNVRGYDLLRSVLDETKKVALAKVRLRTRTRLCLLRPRGRLFSLDMMRFAEELVPGDEIAPAEQKAPTARERQLAEHLVAELSAPFDPAKHPDEYRSAVLAAVDEKVEAGQVAREGGGEAPAEAAAEAGGAQVIDLAELLSRSIKAAGKPGPAKAKAKEEGAEAGEVEDAAGAANHEAKPEKARKESGAGGAKRKRAS